MDLALRAPFPWFGGKSRASHLIWERLGAPVNYIEPFAGSMAVLLGRPHAPGTETVNDRDAYLANFWRAVQADPEAVAAWADAPVNEADLHARHLWLVGQAEFREHMLTDPDFHDPKIAGWWVWGQCAWIGTGWCSAYADPDDGQLPHLGNAGQGVHRKLPHLGDAGRGVHRASLSRQLPHLGNAGRGVHRKLPHLGDAGHGSQILDYFSALRDRLRGVRVACGDWSRVTGDSVTWRHGMTGILLDPPYDEGSMSYSAGGKGISSEVREWAIEAGANPLHRIALCGYEGEHGMPPGWECVAWKAHGGYGSQGDGAGRDNAHRERIWFSPACVKPEIPQMSLFEVKS